MRTNLGAGADLLAAELVGGVNRCNYNQANLELNALAGKPSTAAGGRDSRQGVRGVPRAVGAAARGPTERSPPSSPSLFLPPRAVACTRVLAASRCAAARCPAPTPVAEAARLGPQAAAHARPAGLRLASSSQAW